MLVQDKIWNAGVRGITYRPAEEEDAIEISASTPEKFNERFQNIKESFPEAEFLRVKVEFGIYYWYIVRLGEPR